MLRALSRACWLVVAGLLCNAHARATYSVVAVDPERGMAGVAVASCVGARDLAPLFLVVEGRGVVQTQATTSYYVQQELGGLLARGVSPSRALAQVTAESFDPRRALRQFAVLDFWGRAAAFTGEGDGVWAGDRQGRAGSLTYSLQGNLLTGPAVLDALQSGISRPGACDLTESLMWALEAVVAAPGQGDARCIGEGNTANSGYLRVTTLQGLTLAELDKVDTGDQEVVQQLRSAYQTFRSQHPCGSLVAEPFSCPAASAAAASSERDSGLRTMWLTEWPWLAAAFLAILLRRQRTGMTRLLERQSRAPHRSTISS